MSVKKKHSKKPGHANEPAPVYGDKISVASLEALSDMDREHTRKMTPVQRLEYLHKLISITHGTDMSAEEKAFYEGKIRINQPE